MAKIKVRRVYNRNIFYFWQEVLSSRNFAKFSSIWKRPSSSKASLMLSLSWTLNLSSTGDCRRTRCLFDRADLPPEPRPCELLASDFVREWPGRDLEPSWWLYSDIDTVFPKKMISFFKQISKIWHLTHSQFTSKSNCEIIIVTKRWWLFLNYEIQG